jgi:hypothetical protein
MDVEAYEYDQFTFGKIVLKPDRDAIIRARLVYFDASVRLPGQSVAIYADEVIGKGGMLDLSGGDPKISYSDGARAVDGTTPGEGGTDGRPGSDGQSSGSLRIYARQISGDMSFKLHGGNGGRGEDGGNGAAGRDGPDNNPPGREGASGGAGQNGGTPGKAGLSGAGGNGGTLEVGTIAPIDAQLLASIKSTDVAPGKGGASAVAGNPGHGGRGGLGGAQGHMHAVCHPISHGGDACPDVWEPIGTYPNGQPGVTPPAAQPPPSAREGTPGLITIRSIGSADIAKGETTTHLQNLLELAEGDYLDGQYELAADRLAYVLAVASPRAGISL